MNDDELNVRRELRLVGRVAVAVFLAMLSPLVRLMPRDETLWVFGNDRLFGDSPAYLLEHVSRHEPGISCVWIAATADQRDRARREGYAAFHKWSPRGIALLFRAGVGFVAGHRSHLNRLCIAGMHVGQLWHGFPIKRIYLDHPGDWESKLPLVGGLLTRTSKWSLRRNLRASQVFAAGDIERRRLTTAFGIDADRVLTTGTPREDVILEGRGQGEAREGRPSDLQNGSGRTILYAPTYRLPEHSDPFEDALGSVLRSERLEELLAETGTRMLLKLHPYMHSRASQLDRWIRNGMEVLDGSAPDDINLLLADVDVLVTDYSSVAVDFALLERPIIFFLPDLGLYDRVRSFYGDMSDVTGGTEVEDVNGFVDALEACLLPDHDGERFRAQAKRINETCREWADGRSCERITREVKSSLGLS